MSIGDKLIHIAGQFTGLFAKGFLITSGALTALSLWGWLH